MTSVEELKNALKETLEQRGVLNQIRAIMRQSIFEAIESEDKPQVKLSNENLIINELIKEYLNYNNYLHTSSVFQAETGQPKDALDRNFIAKELNIIETASSRQIPLLYSIIFGLQKEEYNPMAPKQDGQNNFNINSNINPLNIINQNIDANNAGQNNVGSDKKPWDLGQ